MTTATPLRDSNAEALVELERVEKKTRGKLQHQEGCPKNRAEQYVNAGHQVTRCMDCGMHYVEPLGGDAA